MICRVPVYCPVYCPVMVSNPKSPCTMSVELKSSSETPRSFASSEEVSAMQPETNAVLVASMHSCLLDYTL